MKRITLVMIAAFIFLAACNERKSDTGSSESVEQTVAGGEEMVLINGGTYTSIIEMDTLEVKVDPFLMDKHEVTIREFEKFVKATGFIPQTDQPGAKPTVLVSNKIEQVEGVNWKYDERGKIRDTSEYDYPVIYVSYEDAEAYAKWAEKRLPTIYEMEYVATKGMGEESSWNYVITSSWHAMNTRKINLPGLKDSNRLGLYDIYGNVGEHVSGKGSTFPLPPDLALEDLARASVSSFFDDPENIFPPHFSMGHKKGTSFNIGFRCAKDITN